MNRKNKNIQAKKGFKYIKKPKLIWKYEKLLQSNKKIK